jgi:hypothetical protein
MQQKLWWKKRNTSMDTVQESIRYVTPSGTMVKVERGAAQVVGPWELFLRNLGTPAGTAPDQRA